MQITLDFDPITAAAMAVFLGRMEDDTLIMYSTCAEERQLIRNGLDEFHRAINQAETLPQLRRCRLAAQLDFLAKKNNLQPPAINVAVLTAFADIDNGKSAASAYAHGEQVVLQLSRQEAS